MSEPSLTKQQNCPVILPKDNGPRRGYRGEEDNDAIKLSSRNAGVLCVKDGDDDAGFELTLQSSSLLHLNEGSKQA